MNVLIITGVVCVLFAFLASRDEFPFGLEICFSIAAFVAAIRYNYGNDYISYQEIFDFISNREFSWDFVQRNVYFHEPGWTILCFLFKPLGFFSFIAFLSVVQNLVYYFFVKNYVPKEWWALGSFIYLFCTDIYVLNMSMMRQGIAACIFVLSFYFVKKMELKRLPIAFLLVFLASQIHTSSFILYPCLLVAFFRKEWAPYLTVPLFALLVILFLKPDMVNDFLMLFDNVDNLKEYKKYYEVASSRTFSIGILWRLLPFFVLSYCFFSFKNFTEQETKIVFLSMIGFLMIPFSLAVPMIGRLCYFFTPFMISSIPVSYSKLPNTYRNVLLFLFILNLIYGYWTFFHSDTWVEYYYHYQTILEFIF